MWHTNTCSINGQVFWYQAFGTPDSPQNFIGGHVETLYVCLGNHYSAYEGNVIYHFRGGKQEFDYNPKYFDVLKTIILNCEHYFQEYYNAKAATKKRCIADFENSPS